MTHSTVGVSPKTIAAGVAALVTPFLAKTLGLDEAILLGVITALITAAVAYLAPPGRIDDPEMAGVDEAIEDAQASPEDTVTVPDADAQEELA